MGLFDTTVPSTNPSDAEAFKLGASRIRGLQDTLQTMLGQIFATTTTYIPGWLTAAAIATGLITQDKLADGVLSADAAGRLKMADGFVNAAKLDAGLQFTTGLYPVTATGLVLNQVHGLQVAGVAACPRFVRLVMVCGVSDAGWDPGDEIEAQSVVDQAGTPTSLFRFGANTTNMWIAQISNSLKHVHRTTGVSTNLVAARWSVKAYMQV